MAIETKEVIDVQTLPPFKRFIMTIGNIPTSYLESMSYAELLMWFCNYLQNTVIPTVNNNAISLQEVIDYLKTLDLQDEVDTKIDEMVENGTFQALIFDNLGYVTYEMFGAKLDGVTDDTDAVIEAHNYANEHHLKVIQNRGTLYMPSANIDKCPVINTSCDFTGMTLLIDSNNDDDTLMIISDPETLSDDKTDIQKITLNPSQISELYPNNTNVLSNYSAYYNHSIYLTTDMSFGLRNGFSTPVYYKQSFIINDLGQLAPNNMYADISSNATDVTMRYLPLNQNNLEIKFDKIIITGSTENNPRILVMRNNVKLLNAIINKIDSNQQTEWIQPLFDCKYCTNIDVEFFKGYTPTKENYGNDITNYAVSFEECYNIKFSNNELLKGHGAFTSYYCSFINFDNNYINRFDNHYGLYGNVNITNTSIIGYPCKINLGYGNANVSVCNCFFDNYAENGKAINEDVVSCRTDLAVLFSGTINIENCKLNAKEMTNNSNYAGFFQWINDPSNHADFPLWADYNIPIINVKNCDWSVNNVGFRMFRMYNNLTQAYTLRDINIEFSVFKNQSNSIIDIANVTQVSNTFVNMRNCKAKLFNSGGAISFNMYDHSELESVVNTTNVAVYEQGNINGQFSLVNNFGICTTTNNSVITTCLNTGTLISNNTTYNNLRSTGRLMGSSVTANKSWISGLCTPTTLVNTNTMYITGAYFEVTTLTNTSHTIYISGCSMYSSQATKFSDNGTVNGNGNYAGENSSIINTLT